MGDKIEETTTYRINGVEIFAIGEWNGDKYSIEDLHSIVTSYNALKVGFRPYLKLGHDDKQKLARSSGLPSVGWVEHLYVQGDKLIADLNYIPEKVFKLIKSRAYRKVSCEIYLDLTVDGTKYSRVLGGIAFLGAENPGVMNLDDILGSYVFNPNNKNNFDLFAKEDNFKSYSSELTAKLEDEMPEKSEKEIKLELELEAEKKNYAKIEAEKKEITEAKAAADKELEDLKSYKLEAEKKEAQAAIDLATAKREKYVTELVSKKLVTPAMKDLVSELLSDKKEYTVKDKKYSKEGILEEILKLSSEAAKVNFDENSRADYGNKDDEKETEEKIQKYMKDEKCSYVQAYKAVMKSKT